MPVQRNAMKTSKAYRYTSAHITTVQVNVNENGENMLIDAANEPSIAFNPVDCINMVIGWRQFDTIASNFRQAGYGFTLDGGTTWSINESLSEPFDPTLGYPNQNKIGDYYDMFSNSEGAHLAWAATFNGEQDIYYSYISLVTGLNKNILRSSKKYLSQNFPNPFKIETTIRFTLIITAMTTIILTDMQGKVIRKLVHKVLAPGNYQVKFKSENIDPGLYYYTLTCGQIRETRKLIILN